MVVPIDCGFIFSARARSAVVAGAFPGQAGHDGRFGQGKLMGRGRCAHTANQKPDGVGKVDDGCFERLSLHGSSILHTRQLNLQV